MEQEEHALDPGAKLAIILGGVLAALPLMAINSVLPMIQDALAHGPNDNVLVKQMVGIVGLAMVVGSGIAGFLADRISIQRMILIAAPIYVVVGTMGLYLSDLRLLVASRFLLGVAAASIQVTCLILINTRLDGAARAKWMGIHISIAMFATIFVHPIAGTLGELGWRWPFALYFLGFLILPAAFSRNDRKHALPARSAVVEKTMLAELPSFWKSFPFHYLALAICIGSIVFVPTVYAPFLLHQYGVTSPALISLILTADSIAGAAMASLYGKARSRISAHSAFAFSFTFTSAGTLIAGLSTSFPGVFAGLIVYGFGIGWFVPNLMTALAEKLARPQQARAAGLVKAAHFLAAPVAIQMMEPIARRYGPTSAMLVVSALAFVLLVLVSLRSMLLQKNWRNTAPAST